MAYNIELPDGTLIEGVHDDMDPREAVRRWRKSNSSLAEAADRRTTQGVRELEGSSPGTKAFMNLQAGVHRLGRGVAQTLLPKAFEPSFGFTDENIRAREQIDAALARSVPGGKALQIAGNVAPTMLIPGGAIARGVTALPKIGAAAQSVGIGTRALPTLIAEGGLLGAALGVAGAPTTSDDSNLANALMGAAAGAVVPGILAGAGRGLLMLPGARALKERAVSRTIAGELAPPARAPQAAGAMATQIDRGLRAPRVTATPSTAVLTQNPTLASTELAYRSMPEFAPGWQALDEAAQGARWQALDNALGSESTVTAAKQATDDFVGKELPKYLGKLNHKVFGQYADGFMAAVRGRLNAASRNINPSGQEVYGYIVRAVDDQGGKITPQSLWNIRKTLNSWREGTPPPGSQMTRAPELDVHIGEVVGAIDNALNASSGQAWGRFMSGIADRKGAEATQQAGRNIRNVFMSEVTGQPVKRALPTGDPIVTRQALTNAYERFGKTRFGKTLDWPQEDAVTQVLSDLRAQDVLEGAKKAATGGGGSMTAPLGQAVLRHKAGSVGGEVLSLVRHIKHMGAGQQQQIINRMLQEPAYAAEMMRLAQSQLSPLTTQQRAWILAGRTAPLGAAMSLGVVNHH